MAQGTAPAIDPQTMLDQLKSLQQKQTATAKSLLNQTLNDFNNAAGSDATAISFYSQAVWITRFNGRENAATDFETWKKDVLPRMNPAAVRTTLRYTCICLQRAAGGTDEQMFPIVLAYVQSVQPNLDDILAPVPAGSLPNSARGNGRRQRGQPGNNQQNGGAGPGAGLGGGDPGEQIMQEDVAQNVFSRWYQVQGMLSELQDWENVPANIDGMYSQFLLPIMRQNHDRRAVDYWDNRIELARDEASSAAVAFNADTYNNVTRPALLWSRAEEEIAIGEKNQGIADMYSTVKSYPGHTDAKKWIAELEGILSSSVAAGGTAPATPH